MKKSSIIFLIIVGILVFYISDRCGNIYFSSTEATALDKLNELSETCDSIFAQPYLALNKNALLCGFGGVFCYLLAVLYFAFGRKNYLQGREHGSAQWGTPADIKKYKDRKPENNMLLSQSECMSLNTRKTMRNNNVLVIGGSGSGKTRFYVKPNLFQLHTSYVVTDPKGTLLLEVGKLFADNGYKIKVFNTVDFSKSMHYNPFTFIKGEADIKVFTDLLITSTKEKGEKSADQFWENSERLLYMALIGYIYYELNEDEHNFASLLAMINSMEVHENDEAFMNNVDYMFEELEIGTEEFCKKYNQKIEEGREIKPPQPEHFALSQYKKYKLAAGKTAKSILISCGVRLAAFDVKQVRDMTMYDEMELSTIGDRKTALFIIIDDKVSTFNFLAAMMYSQLFKELCDKADNVYGGRLPIHVRCMLDEFANSVTRSTPKTVGITDKSVA